MLDLGISREKSLTGEQAQALILQGCLASVGEGMPLAQLRKFVRVQSGRHFSDHVCDKTLHAMVKSGSLNIDVTTTKGGVMRRRYFITTGGICMLYALGHHLPKQSRDKTLELLQPLVRASGEIMFTSLQQNGNAK